jgi:hypothetical protein
VSERLCVQVVVDAGGIDQLVLYTQRMLGEGSTGTVFEGWYQGQVCAVKRMNETDRGALREIDAYRSQKLRHPSLVHMQTVKSEYQLLYLAMDLCHCSLSTTTVREATWTQPAACTGVLCFARRCSDCPIMDTPRRCVCGGPLPLPPPPSRRVAVALCAGQGACGASPRAARRAPAAQAREAADAGVCV